MSKVIESLSWLYPCTVCATDFREKIAEHPPRLAGRDELSLWFCEQHNLVNQRLGKADFNCNMRRLRMMYGQDIDLKFVNKTIQERREKLKEMV